MKKLTLLFLTLLLTLTTNAFQMSVSLGPTTTMDDDTDGDNIPNMEISPWDGTYKGDFVSL